MKREFGKKLIEDVLPRLDLTHIVDCSGAYIPGHGTPTAVLFGRNRAPVEQVVRTVRGVRGEPTAPEDPARGRVWSAVVAQTDLANSESPFISTEDTLRDALAVHPWNMGGGGAADVQAAIEDASAERLVDQAEAVGFMAITGEDEAFAQSSPSWSRRFGFEQSVRPYSDGDDVRDWNISAEKRVFFPFDAEGRFLKSASMERALWRLRTNLASTIYFGKDKAQRGLHYCNYAIFVRGKDLKTPFLSFSEVATANHFAFCRGGIVLNKTAPVIKLRASATTEEHLGLLGLLNSSTGCFWLKQVCHNKGATVDGRGARQRTNPFEDFYQLNGTRVGQFPLAAEYPVDLARALDAVAQHLSANMPAAVCARATPTRGTLNAARGEAEAARARMIALQEELDWRCYRLYGLHDASPEHGNPPPLCLAERAFEIVMARQMAAGELETTWFERHRSMPVTELPTHWPEDYLAVVERRIALIESDPTIGLIERPEFKRRWSAPPWDEMERDAVRAWLLDRLEDARFWPASEPHILSARALADAARHDPDFLSVAELYVGRAGFDLEALIAELLAGESVPFLAALRYTDSGLRKRADWEATWGKQRAEDVIDADVAARSDEFVRAAWARMNPRDGDEAAEAYAARMIAGLDAEDVQKAADSLIAAEAERRKQAEVGDLPVPPKYKTVDFQSQDFWRLRGGLDIPKERFVSFPHGARDADPSLPVLWAGHDHLARARAIAAWYVERRETDGWPAERLKPLLAGLLELVPWLRQWHNAIDPETGLRMGDYFLGYVEEQARELGLTLDDLRTWRAPTPGRRGRGRRTAA
jgi:hypothetical protein